MEDQTKSDLEGTLSKVGGRAEAGWIRVPIHALMRSSFGRSEISDLNISDFNPPKAQKGPLKSTPTRAKHADARKPRAQAAHLNLIFRQNRNEKSSVMTENTFYYAQRNNNNG